MVRARNTHVKGNAERAPVYDDGSIMVDPLLGQWVIMSALCDAWRDSGA
jgi:hypothetical protein